jgi:histidyl-tRNA synthetase
MLVGDRAEERLGVIIAVEQDETLALAQKALAALRGSGISAEMIASGSPKKRFDKAVKTNARVMVTSWIKDGDAILGTRSADKDPLEVRVQEIIGQLGA